METTKYDRIIDAKTEAAVKNYEDHILNHLGETPLALEIRSAMRRAFLKGYGVGFGDGISQASDMINQAKEGA